MLVHDEPATERFPVFYDRSGKRWRRILLIATAVACAIGAVAAWLMPPAAAPLWPSRAHPANYPEQLAASGQLRSLPVLGQEGTDDLARVDRVRRDNGHVYLTDPFTGKVIRQATGDEVQAIGNHNFAMEWFSHLPDHEIALSFDDGPDVRNTPTILNILSKYHIRATFFDIGQRIMADPSLLQREIREGHVVGNHTLSHIGFGHGSARDREELIGDGRIIRASADYATRLFRIPYGDPDSNPVAVLEAQQLGYVTVDYDLDTNDWQYRPGQTVPMPRLDGRGHLVLMHDGGANRQATINLLPRFISQAQKDGYTFVTVSSLVPKQDVPVKNAPPALGDRVTYAGLWMLMMLPVLLITWLYWIGIGTLLIRQTLYLVLALFHHRRGARRAWPPLPTPAPVVSVLIPAFNEQDVIEKTIRSVEACDYPNLEIVVVDDGSADRTWDVLCEIASSSKVSIHRLPENRGKSAALNFGIAQCSGDVVVTMDGDTVFEPDAVRMLARHFFADPAVGAVAGNVKVGNRRWWNVLTLWQSVEYLSGISVTRMAEACAGAITIAPGCCAAWRRNVMIAAGGFADETLAEDFDLTLRIQRMGHKVVQENRAVAWTEVPMTVRSLAKQRLRWTFGNLQAFWKHRDMLMRPRYGVLGILVLPYSVLSILIPLAFMPLTYVVGIMSVMAGHWQPIAYFAALVCGVHLVTAIAAVVMTRERWWHVLVVPIYRLIYEPLWAYLLYGSLLRVMRGGEAKWYRPARTNTVNAVSLPKKVSVIP
jgi:biofilm PGA synthesis N-glycosyltransferase PgaC